MVSRTTFTHVVPLGLSCRVTYQARTYFRAGVSHPFDWWITPVEGLARYISLFDPDRIYRADALGELIEDGWISSIASREFGFLLYHEFPRRKAAPPIRVVSADWRAGIAAARETHVRKLERLAALDRPGNRILFVRDRLESAEDPASTQALVDALWQALRGRWSAAQITLLLVNLPAFTPPCASVVRANFDDPAGPPPESWRGEDARWAAAFAALGFDPPGAGAPAPPPPWPGEAA
jgi:hypothetical protein